MGAFDANLTFPQLDPAQTLEALQEAPWVVGQRIGPEGRLFDDDFERFMDQAGYVTDTGSDPLPWLQGQSS